MAFAGAGELIPIGEGGDNIPLVRSPLTVGRRESSDICLMFSNVSSRHCELTFKDGYWYIQDLNSTNGVKVNGERVQKKVLRPGDVLTIAKHNYRIEYQAATAGPGADAVEEEDDILGVSLLEKAGLEPRRRPPAPPRGKPPAKPPAPRTPDPFGEDE